VLTSSPFRLDLSEDGVREKERYELKREKRSLGSGRKERQLILKLDKMSSDRSLRTESEFRKYCSLLIVTPQMLPFISVLIAVDLY
jgi:hypothetical protein